MRSLDTAVGDVAPTSPDEPTEKELSRLSLVQALRDFEVANGRVIDLTERLVVTADELMKTREELDGLRAERDDLAARLADLNARHDALLEAHQKTLERKSVKLGETIWAARRSITSRRQDG
jgi:cell division protein FtsB